VTDPLLASTFPECLTAILRGPGWRRAALARRWLAGLLALAAVVLAVRGQLMAAGRVPVLVAARDLAPGTVLGAADTRIARWPPELVPAEALTASADAEGRVIAGAANRGEPLTAPRLAVPSSPAVLWGPRTRPASRSGSPMPVSRGCSARADSSTS
jgi:Flp pilus assembly protein CpaB